MPTLPSLQLRCYGIVEITTDAGLQGGAILSKGSPAVTFAIGHTSDKQLA